MRYEFFDSISCVPHQAEDNTVKDFKQDLTHALLCLEVVLTNRMQCSRCIDKSYEGVYTYHYNKSLPVC